MSQAALAAKNATRLRPTRDVVRPALIFAIFAALPLIAALAGKQYLIDVGARMMVFAVAAVALDLLELIAIDGEIASSRRMPPVCPVCPESAAGAT